MKTSIFEKFTCFEGSVPDEYEVDFLGVLTRKLFYQSENFREEPGRSSALSVRTTAYPPVNYDLFEWIDLLEAVVAAGSHTGVSLAPVLARH